MCISGELIFNQAYLCLSHTPSYSTDLGHVMGFSLFPLLLLELNHIKVLVFSLLKDLVLVFILLTGSDQCLHGHSRVDNTLRGETTQVQ